MTTIYNGAIFSAVSALNDAENHTCPPNRFFRRQWRSASRYHGYRADANAALCRVGVITLSVCIRTEKPFDA